MSQDLFVTYSKYLAEDFLISLMNLSCHSFILCLSYGPRQANLVLIAYASSESRGTFRQKARSLAPLNGWACAVNICHDGMLEDTNSLDGAHIVSCARSLTIFRVFFSSLCCLHANFVNQPTFKHYKDV